MKNIWTIGHSTRGIEEFIALLRENKINALADVRLLPGSGRYPHFNAEALRESLGQNQIVYEHFPELGGRRKPRADSPNRAWRNDAFRGYADYMETKEFAAGIQRLKKLAETQGATAVMCAEAVWWQCHRSLISDYLKVRGVEVRHILAKGKVQEHPYTSAATLVNGKLSYAGEETLL
jgi:uncharacterized protein (DUF488 family)